MKRTNTKKINQHKLFARPTNTNVLSSLQDRREYKMQLIAIPSVNDNYLFSFIFSQ